MRARRAPLFLKRRSYRRRRLRDAARMLPVVGLFLLMLPMLWANGSSERQSTAWDGLFVFAVWSGLLVAAAAMAPGLSEEQGADGEGGAAAAGRPQDDA
ncbi:hypothetical protein GU927_016145 [Rhodobacteraceae bacterium HSP-20]|uniref:Uncharacterized protein n=1 Tax=Paragemmobacter amnigenus TaxID=2852097 RepID=A0ABS6J713_9RHOB|nr:hypothetical protein [Rhodobacter amnigenus]MBU9699378.1 hypothetical protein [Rhodobacter amnigenus]MBV4390605.1 hypothetical protein [Rhodobacter amnigenus]